VIGIDDEDDSTFTITVDQSRSYYFQGDSMYLFYEYARFQSLDKLCHIIAFVNSDCLKEI